MSRVVVTAILLFAGLLLARPEAHAFSYTYMEAGYGYTDVHNGGRDGGGVAAQMSAQIRRNVHMFARYGAIGGNDSFALGMGLHDTLSRRVGVLGRLAWVDVMGNNGLHLEAALRGWVSGVDLTGGAYWSGLDLGNESGLFAEAYVPLGDRLGFVAGIAGSDNYTSIRLTARVNF